MDIQLKELVQSISGIIDYKNIDVSNDFIFEFTDSVDGSRYKKRFFIAASIDEPYDSLSYANGIWINLNPLSAYYQCPLRLVGKVASTEKTNTPFFSNIGQVVSEIIPIVSKEFRRKWELVTEASAIFKYENFCFLPGATEGEKGDQGDQGDPGDDTAINIDEVVSQAVLEFLTKLS